MADLHPDLGVSGRPPRVLLAMLEFASWRGGRAWGYSGHFGLDEGLRAAGAECTVLPALHEVPSNAPHSWLAHARQTLAGERFDQVWVWLVHHDYDPAFWAWVKTLAPVVVGLVFESLEHRPEELERFPHLAKRERYVADQLAHVTHALAVDERDVAWIEEQGLAKARWLPTAVPRRYMRSWGEPSERSAVFYGCPYGERGDWFQEPALAGLMVHGGDAEAGTTIPERHDTLHVASCEYLANGGRPTREVLEAYVDACRALRREAFENWLRQLARWPATIALPSIGKIYTSRVMEAMAVGRPVLSWRIPDRPRNEALFVEDEEIRLFEGPEELATKLQLLREEPALAQAQADAAQRKVWSAHSVEEQAAGILRWIEGEVAAEDDASEAERRTAAAFGAFEDVLGGRLRRASPQQRMQAAARRIASAERAAADGQLPRAIQIVEAVRAMEPGMVGVHRLLARLHRQGGDGWGAVRALDEGLRQHPSAVDLLVPAAELAAAQGDLGGALKRAAGAYPVATGSKPLTSLAQTLEALAQSVAAEAKQTLRDERRGASKKGEDFALPEGYESRKEIAHHDDRAFADEWQDEVYQRARQELEARCEDPTSAQVLDIGCGSAFKLLKYFGDCKTIGMELSPAYEFLLERHPERTWLRSTFARPLPQGVDLVIVSDVIEHLPDPDALLRFLGSFAWQAAVLSTPDRELIGGDAAGPPENRCHAREWTSAEFRAYLERSFIVEAQEVCNREQGTQLVVLRQRPAAALSEFRSVGAGAQEVGAGHKAHA